MNSLPAGSTALGWYSLEGNDVGYNVWANWKAKYLKVLEKDEKQAKLGEGDGGPLKKENHIWKAMCLHAFVLQEQDSRRNVLPIQAGRQNIHWPELEDGVRNSRRSQKLNGGEPGNGEAAKGGTLEICPYPFKSLADPSECLGGSVSEASNS